MLTANKNIPNGSTLHEKVCKPYSKAKYYRFCPILYKPDPFLLNPQ